MFVGRNVTVDTWPDAALGRVGDALVPVAGRNGGRRHEKQMWRRNKN